MSYILKVEMIKDFKDEKDIYNFYEVDSMKVYILKGLKVASYVNIYQRLKLPILGAIVAVNGVKL